LAAAVQALCLTWGGAALVSWYTWSSASDFWTVFGRPVPAGLRSEDDRLFLQDAFVTSLAAAIAVVTVLVVARRRPSTAVAGKQGCPDGLWHAHGAQGVDVRGWSLTRFGTVVVLTGGGAPREIVCR
jgi:hypothetical protein